MIVTHDNIRTSKYNKRSAKARVSRMPQRCGPIAMRPFPEQCYCVRFLLLPAAPTVELVAAPWVEKKDNHVDFGLCRHPDQFLLRHLPSRSRPPDGLARCAKRIEWAGWSQHGEVLGLFPLRRCGWRVSTRVCLCLAFVTILAMLECTRSATDVNEGISRR